MRRWRELRRYDAGTGGGGGGGGGGDWKAARGEERGTGRLRIPPHTSRSELSELLRIRVANSEVQLLFFLSRVYILLIVKKWGPVSYVNGNIFLVQVSTFTGECKYKFQNLRNLKVKENVWFSIKKCYCVIQECCNKIYNCKHFNLVLWKSETWIGKWTIQFLFQQRR